MKDNSISVIESKRLNALHDYRILDSRNDPEFNKLAEIAAMVCETPVAYISFIDADRHWIKGGCGIEWGSSADRELSMCNTAIRGTTLLEVEDTLLDARFDNKAFVTGPPNIRFYAGQPLVDPNGFVLGTFCVFDTKPGKLNERQKRTLALLSEQVITLTVNQRKNEEQRYFDRLFDLTEDLICVVDREGRFKRLNPAFGKLLGYHEDFFSSHTLYDLVIPEDHALAVQELNRMDAGNGIVNFFLRFRSKDGKEFYLQWVGTLEPETGFVFAIGRNVTDEKDKEALLRASEDRFRTFFDNSQGLMCTHDLAGNFLTVNSAGAGLLGYTREEALGLNLKHVIPSDFHKQVDAYLEEIGTKGRAAGLITTVNRRGTRSVWRYNNILHYEADGNAYVIGNSIDVTQSHNLAKNLQWMQEMLTETNQMAKVGGWEFDVIHNKLSWSQMTRQLHEVDDNFVPTLEKAITFYRDGQSREKIAEAVLASTKENKSFDLELELITAKGKKIWVRVIGHSKCERGVCKRIYGTFQDIDERKKSEHQLTTERARLRAFVQHAPAAVAMFDKEIKYLAISNRWLEDYKLTGRDIIGLSHYEVFPSIGAEWKEVHQRCLLGEVLYSQEDRWRPDTFEEEQFLKWEVRPWYQFDGSVGGIMMFTQDITEAALAKEELREAKFQSEQASIAKSEFLANMSHEIRTPLNGVIGFTDLVMKTKMTDMQRQYLGFVNQSANTLLGIINDILDFSKIEAGKLDLDIEKCDLYEMTAQSADIISFPVQSKGLEMLLNIPDHLPRYVWVDEIRLKQVMINLLSNAAKFTEQGEIELKIELLEYTPERSQEMTCRFTVRDTGIGIQQDKQAKIFEAFLQEDGSTTKKYGGTGLGLAISNKLLKMMGSELRLRSQPGEGSLFYFDLKMKCEPGETWRPEIPGRIRKVLLVDDNENNLMILDRMLEQLGIRSEKALSGFSALEMLGGDAAYDAVMMDYQMPAMDGLSTAEKIRALTDKTKSQIPIVLLSSYGNEEAFSSKLEELAIQQCLKKPISLDEITLSISQLSRRGGSKSDNGNDGGEHISLAPFTVLIAEDNPANMFLTRTIINKMAPNAVIAEAANGAQAVAFCENKVPDIIFMDVQMPVMNGYEATRAIRVLAGGSGIPIIALTAGNVKGEREKCMEAGMSDFVTKPFVQKDLWAVLSMVPGFTAAPAVSQSSSEVEEAVLKKVLDLGKVRAAYLDDDGFVREILMMTREALVQNAEDLDLLNKDGNLAGLRAGGHKLKGVARAVFLTTVTDIAEQIEHLESYDPAHVTLLLDALGREIAVLLPLLEQRANELAGS